MSKGKPGLKKLKSILGDVKSGMLITICQDTKKLHSRPMMYRKLDFEKNEIWFFTKRQTSKVNEIQHNSRVNLSFISPKMNSFVSLYGDARIIDDYQKEQELWSPLLRTWFPLGLKDPSLALICVHIDFAEYWDSASSSIVQLAGMAKALLSGERYRPLKPEYTRVALN